MIYNSGEDKLLKFAYNLKLIPIVLCEGTPSFRAVVNHAGLFWFSMYRFSVFNGAPPAVPA